MNAYEIRLDILKMAQGMVQEKYYQKRELLQAADDRAQSEWYESGSDEKSKKSRGTLGDSHTFTSMDKIERLYPTTEEVKDCAAELYQFVTEE